jgi:hypothetical protein
LLQFGKFVPQLFCHRAAAQGGDWNETFGVPSFASLTQKAILKDLSQDLYAVSSLIRHKDFTVTETAPTAIPAYK